MIAERELEFQKARGVALHLQSLVALKIGRAAEDLEALRREADLPDELGGVLPERLARVTAEVANLLQEAIQLRGEVHTALNVARVKHCLWRGTNL